MSRSNFFLWYKRFLEGRERLEYDNREGMPISEMLITFLDSKRIIQREFVPTGQTITGVYYHEVLKCLMARIRCIRPEYRDLVTCSLLHDNAFESLLNRCNKCIETG